MKYFTALEDATFARAAFAAAGFDFDAEKAKAKGKEKVSVLSDSMAASKSAEEFETAMNSAKQENDELRAENAALNSKLKAIGMNPEASEADVKKAHEDAITKAARNKVAQAGHPGVVEALEVDPTKAKKVEDKPVLTGRDRIRAGIIAEISEKFPGRRTGRN